MFLQSFRSIFSLLLLLFLSTISIAGPEDQLRDIGDSIRRPNTAKLLELAEKLKDNPGFPGVQSALKNAAVVYAYSTGDPEQIRMVTAALKESENNGLVSTDLLNKLGPIELSIDPMSVSSDAMQLVSDVRQSIVEAAMIGNTARIEDQLKALTETGLPVILSQAIIKYGNDSLEVAKLIPPSPLKIAMNISVASQLQNALAEDRACEALAAYIAASPEEREKISRTRADGTNQYDLMKEIVNQQPALVTALSKIQEQYWAGELKRAEAIIKMQEAIGNSLDLKMKRAVIYWQMKELRQEKKAEEHQATLERNYEQTQALQARTFEDISPTWPSILQHRALRDSATQLRKELRSYSPQNSGAISVCFSRCNVHLRKLERLLENDLDGLTLQQRALLRTYLRELEESLQEPFESDGALYRLAKQDIVPAGETFADSNSQLEDSTTQQSDLPAIGITLSGDETELASFAIYQSILGSMVRAGTDQDQLSEVAKMVRKSSLLNDKHRKSLQQIGSKIYRGEINIANLAELDDPVSTLVRISGIIDNDEFGKGLPENVREEAFQILLADVTRKPLSN